MLPQTQSDKPITQPSSSIARCWTYAPARTERWLILALSVLIVAVLLISGIWTRVRAKAALANETTQTAVIAVSVVQPQRTAPDPGDHSSRECRAVRFCPDLLQDEWVPREVVCRHRSSCQTGTVVGGDSDP